MSTDLETRFNLAPPHDYPIRPRIARHHQALLLCTHFGYFGRIWSCLHCVHGDITRDLSLRKQLQICFLPRGT
jgi:hypothetical protein